MPIEDKIPKGKFGVILWDAYPRMKPPMWIDEIFDTEKEANKYASQKNKDLEKEVYEKRRLGTLTAEENAARIIAPEIYLIEPGYIVIDNKGVRW
jgi:hypothetical protein